MYFLKGGNWQDGISAGFLSCGWPTIEREIISPWIFETEGLPDRWIKILMGETSHIPKIVFELKAKRGKDR